MKDPLYIKGRLDELLNLVPQGEDKQLEYNELKQLALWIYNMGNLRTEKELQNRLQNYKDELTALHFMGTVTPYTEKPILRKISIVQDFLED